MPEERPQRERRQAPAQAKPKPKKSKKKKIIGVTLLFILTLGGGVVGSLFLPDNIIKPIQTQLVKVAEIFEKEPVVVIVPMESFLTNIQSKKGKEHVIQMEVSIEVTGEDDQLAVSDKQLGLRDSVLTVLRGEKVEAFRDQKEIERIKTDMKKAFEATLEEVTIDQVYISDLVIQ